MSNKTNDQQDWVLPLIGGILSIGTLFMAAKSHNTLAFVGYLTALIWCVGIVIYVEQQKRTKSVDSNKEATKISQPSLKWIRADATNLPMTTVFVKVWPIGKDHYESGFIMAVATAYNDEKGQPTFACFNATAFTAYPLCQRIEYLEDSCVSNKKQPYANRFQIS